MHRRRALPVAGRPGQARGVHGHPGRVRPQVERASLPEPDDVAKAIEEIAAF